MGDHRKLPVFFLRDLDAALHTANGVEIFGQLGSIGGGEGGPPTGDFSRYGIENAFLLEGARDALFRIGAAAVAEQTLEQVTRIILRRERRAGAAPAPRIGVRAGITGVATAGGFPRLDPQLQRRKLSLLAEFLRKNLIH